MSNVFLTPQAILLFDRWIANMSSTQRVRWEQEESQEPEHQIRWTTLAEYFSQEFTESTHKQSSARAKYEATIYSPNGRKYDYVLYEGAMGDWIDEEMSEPQHKDIWPNTYQTVHNAPQFLLNDLDEYVTDENRDYNKYLVLANELDNQGLGSDANTIRGIAEQEKQHKELLMSIRKSISRA